MDYFINPVKMGGLIKEVTGDTIKVHLHGRLGVITVPQTLIIHEKPLAPGDEVAFYFSYIQITAQPYDYDVFRMTVDKEPSPCFLGGKIIEVNDTAAKIAITDHLGTIAVPRRWLFTPVPLAVGLDAEFYFSCMKVIGKREIPVESI